IPLVEKLGQIFAALVHSPLTSLDVEVHGELNDYDVSALKLSALKGVFTDVVSDKVSYVNAPVIAEQRGVEVQLVTSPETEYFRNETILTASLAHGGTISVAGTVTGPKHVQKITKISGYDLEIPISEHLLIIEYQDRAGVIAAMSTVLGSSSINIASMQVSRGDKDNRAVAVFALDSAPSTEVFHSIERIVDAKRAALVNLSE
ncbi:MAG: phosphoglycerate dehydrogenase, partial [Rothia sp. (in: high G+C Gram-positive bacteria)]|nr:phosphoglycerate dehydrogenase [Rothia sp. (in: high G+C Gram-positive bacteria)]